METVSGLEESPVSKFGSICRLAENAKSSDIDNKSVRALYLSLLAVMGGGKLDNPEFSPLAIFGNVAIGRTTFGNVALGVTTFGNVAKGFTTFGNVTIGVSKTLLDESDASKLELVEKVSIFAPSIGNESSSVPPKNASNRDGDSETLNLGASNFDPVLPLKL